MMYKIDVPYIDQSVRYPTGCESVTATMLLQFLGYDITVDTFIEQYLECEKIVEQDGILYGPDPNQYFVGSPYDDESFGCYASVICKALEKCAGDQYTVLNETGSSLKDLTERYIENGVPVIIWACINMRSPIVGPIWKLPDGGEFTWISNEHCMLLVGYDDENYYFNDPYENNGVIGYPKETVNDRYHAQHMQAVVLI